MEGYAGHVSAAKQNSSIGRQELPADHVDQRRLAGAVRPDYAQHLAGRDGERDLVENFQTIEAFGDPVHNQISAALAHVRSPDAKEAEAGTGIADTLAGRSRRNQYAPVPTMPSLATSTTIIMSKPNRPCEYSPRMANRSDAQT